jgi:serine phosphatase RsbU (regulator of sigma subunit)/tetratricopeptide (TPR) repeat protein
LKGFWLFWITLGILSAQKTALAEIETLLEEGENVPEAEVEPLARRALDLFQRYYAGRNDTQAARLQGKILSLLAYGLAYRGAVDSAFLLSDSAYRLLAQAGYLREAMGEKGNLAYYYHQQGKVVPAIHAYREGERMARSLGERELLFYTLNNLAGLFSEIGLQDSAASLYKQALILSDSLGKPKFRALALHNLSALYETQALYDYALRYAQEALALRRASGDSAYIASTLSAIGRLYRYQRMPDSSAFYYKQAYAVAKATHNLPVLGVVTANIARAYMDEAQWDSAYKYLQEAFQVRSQMAPNEQLKAYWAWAEYYLKRAEAENPSAQGSFLGEALRWVRKGEALLQKGGVYDIDAISQFHQTARLVYEALGLPAEAYNHYQKYVAARDSLVNTRAQRKAIESRYQYEWLQQEQRLREEMLRQQIQAEERQKRQKLWISFLAALALILAVGGGLLFRLYRETRRQRDLISHQKAALERSHAIIAQQHEELLQSLRYAKRIQRALLPPAEWLETLPFAHALWYQPQGEVGGDFYWARRFAGEKYLLVLGDCTGHGVPGGFMTVLAITLLEKATEEESALSLPALAEFLHNEMTRLLHAEQIHGVRDGMEGSFVLIDYLQNQVEILNAGSYCWWIPQGGDLQEIGPSGPGIAVVFFANQGPITWQVHTRPFERGGRLILASDGLRDQLNAERKKWNRKALRQMLQEVAPLPPAEACNKTQAAWEAHRGVIPQIDDVSLWIIDLPAGNQIA